MKSASTEVTAISPAPQPPESQIFFSGSLYSIRFNCLGSGGIFKTETRRLADKGEFLLFRVTRFWGDMGKTSQTEWLQFLLVPVPGQNLPCTPCVAYVKGQSAQAFSDFVTELSTGCYIPHEDAQPIKAENFIKNIPGVLRVGFEEGRGGKGPYSVVRFGFRAFKDGEGELAKELKEFSEANPEIVDFQGTKLMVPVMGLAEGVLSKLMELRAVYNLPMNLAVPTAKRIVISGEDESHVLSGLPPAS